MIRRCATVIALGALLAGLSGAMTGQDVKTVLSNAAKAMGAGNLETIQYSGAGFSFHFGQAPNPNVPWPRFPMPMYNREIDFSAPASHVTVTVNEPQEQFIAANAPWAQQVDIWVTPYGFLKGAIAAGNATMSRRTIGGKKYKVVSYTAENRYPLNESREIPGEDYIDVTYTAETKGTLSGYINDQNMVERVDTWIGNPVLGDMLIESTYTAYRDFAGLKFPTRIVQKQGGFPVLDLTVTGVKANAAVSVQPPVSNAPAPPLQTEKIADGVFYLEGSYHSVAVEFKDYAAVIEAPVDEARSLAVIAETKNTGHIHRWGKWREMVFCRGSHWLPFFWRPASLSRKRGEPVAAATASILFAKITQPFSMFTISLAIIWSCLVISCGASITNKHTSLLRMALKVWKPEKMSGSAWRNSFFFNPAVSIKV